MIYNLPRPTGQPSNTRPSEPAKPGYNTKPYQPASPLSKSNPVPGQMGYSANKGSPNGGVSAPAPPPIGNPQPPPGGISAPAPPPGPGMPYTPFLSQDSYSPRGWNGPSQSTMPIGQGFGMAANFGPPQTTQPIGQRMGGVADFGEGALSNALRSRQGQQQPSRQSILLNMLG